NYADRIDPAIKRTGRIDKQYLLNLPNAARRIQIMKHFKLNVSGRKSELEKASLFLGYTDLKGVTQDAGGEAATEAGVLALLSNKLPVTSTKSYLNRLSPDEEFPTEEFKGLVELASEVDGLSKVKAEIEQIKNEQGPDGQQTREQLLKKYGLLD